MSRLLTVKVFCHQCDKFRVRQVPYDEDVTVEELAAQAMAQLNQVDQCPHNLNNCEITSFEDRNKAKRKKVRYV